MHMQSWTGSSRVVGMLRMNGISSYVESDAPKDGSSQTALLEAAGTCHLLADHNGVRMFCTSGVDAQTICEAVEKWEGKVEYHACDNLLIQRVDGTAISETSMWLMGDYHNFFKTGHRWCSGSTGHFATADTVVIPDGYAFYKPERRQLCAQKVNATSVGVLPHWMMYVEWEHLVGNAGFGFDKIRRHIFNMRDINDECVLEAWLVSIPLTEVSSESAIVAEGCQQITELPTQDKPFIAAQSHRPEAGVPYVAFLRHDPAAYPTVYFPLCPNTRFVPPSYTVLRTLGTQGGAAFPGLDCNELLVDLGLVTIA
jgi:hypothetical protein